MKNKYSIFIITTCLFVLLSCSSYEPQNSSHSPIIVDKNNILNDTLKSVINSFEYPLDLIPVVVAETSIEEQLYTSAKADEIFDNYANEYEDFDQIGLLVYITQAPHLIQIRLGKYYSAYAEMTGAIQGREYIRAQELFNTDSSLAISNLLNLVKNCINSYCGLPSKVRIRAEESMWALDKTLSWSGTPSKSFYGTYIARPIYNIITFGTKTFNSWLIGLCMVFLVVYIIKIILSLIVAIVTALFIPNLYFRKATVFIITFFIGGIISLLPVGCAISLSSCRIEDFISLSAFGISNLDYFLMNPDYFVPNNSLLLSLAFIILLDFYFECTNNIYLISLLPINKQKEIWNSLPKEDRDLLLDVNNVNKIYDVETPYIAMIRKASVKRRLYITPLIFGAILFFSRAILYAGIAYAIIGMLFGIPNILSFYSKYKNDMDFSFMLGRLIATFLALVLPISIVLIIHNIL